MYYYAYDALYFVLLIAIVISMIANWRVNSIFKKFSDGRNLRGITGAQAADAILRRNGINNVGIQETSGTLSDNYNPADNCIRLSSDVYYGTSAVAVGVACHEAGHAMQYAENYLPAKIRMAIVPATNLGSRLAFPLILGGFLLSRFSAVLYQLVYVGIACFALSTFFQLITLPTEFDASHRALKNIQSCGILTEAEYTDAKKVLWAAAMTYVAALAVSAIQLLRFIMIYGGGNRRRR